MKINKPSIQQKVIEGESGEAIQMFLQLSTKYDKNLHSELIQLSGRYNSLLREKMAGVADSQNVQIQMARINNSLTYLLDKVKPEWVIDEEANENDGGHGGIKATSQTILFLAANPKNTEPIRLDEEVRKIEEGLRRSRNRDQISFKQRWAVQITDLRRALLDESPNIIHFSGHGSDLGRIYLEDPSGKGFEVNPEALAGLLEMFNDHLECVLLNACYSETQAKAIARSVKYVIGMNNAIPDHAAIAFSEAFYDAIANGRDIDFAFRMAKNAIAMHNLNGDQIPVLLQGG